MIMWFANWTVFGGQARVTGSAGSSSFSAAKIARVGSACRPRFAAGSASRSTVRGRLPAARDEAPSVVAPRRGEGPAAAAPACADSALSSRRRSAKVWSSGSTDAEP
ncbi:unnamed protein product [Prunus armeniaca]